MHLRVTLVGPSTGSAVTRGSDSMAPEMVEVGHKVCGMIEDGVVSRWIIHGLPYICFSIKANMVFTRRKDTNVTTQW